MISWGFLIIWCWGYLLVSVKSLLKVGSQIKQNTIVRSHFGKQKCTRGQQTKLVTSHKAKSNIIWLICLHMASHIFYTSSYMSVSYPIKFFFRSVQGVEALSGPSRSIGPAGPEPTNRNRTEDYETEKLRREDVLPAGVDRKYREQPACLCTASAQGGPQK